MCDASLLSSFTGMAAVMLPNVVVQLREEFIPLLITLEGVDNVLNHTYLIELIFTLVNFDAFLRPEEREAFMRASDKLLSSLIKDLKKVREMRKYLEENKIFLMEIIQRCTLLQDICETKLNEDPELLANLPHNDNKRANTMKINLDTNPGDNIFPRAHMTTHSSDSNFSDSKQRPGSVTHAYSSECTTSTHRCHPQGLAPTTDAFDTVPTQNNLESKVLFETYQATKDSLRRSMACRSVPDLSPERCNSSESTQSLPEKTAPYTSTGEKRGNPTEATMPRQHPDLLLFSLFSNASNATQRRSSSTGSVPSDDKFLAALPNFTSLPDIKKLQCKEGNASFSLAESYVSPMKNAWERSLWEFLNGFFFWDDLLLVGTLLSMQVDFPFATEHNIRNNLDSSMVAQKIPGVVMNSVGRQSTSPNSPLLFMTEAAAAAAVNTHAAVWEKNNSFHDTNTISKSWQSSGVEATHLLSALGGVEPVRWEFWTAMQAVFTVLMEGLLGKSSSDKSNTLNGMSAAADGGNHPGGMNENLYRPGVGKRHTNSTRNGDENVHAFQYLHSSGMPREELELKGGSPSEQDPPTCSPENAEYDATMTSVSMLECGRTGQTHLASGVHPPSAEALGLLKNVFCPNLHCYAIGARNFISAAPLLAARAATAALVSVASAAASASSAEAPLQSQTPEIETILTSKHPLDTPSATLDPSNCQDQKTHEGIGNLGLRILSHLSMDSINSIPHHSCTSSIAPENSTLSLNPNLFAFSTDVGLLTENMDDNPDHKNDIRPVDVLVYAFTTAIQSQIQQCASVSTSSDALDGSCEQSKTASKAKEQIHQSWVVRTDETRPMTPSVEDDPTLLPSRIGSRRTVVDPDGLVDRDRATETSKSDVKGGSVLSAGGITVCDLGCGTPGWEGAQRRRARGETSLVTSMRDVLSQLLSNVQTTIMTTQSMEDQLEGEITLLTFRIVNTIVDLLIPAVYLVDMRIWLFYRKWLCSLYQILQQEGLLERFYSMLNCRVGPSVGSLDEDSDTIFSVKDASNQEMRRYDGPSGAQEGYSDSQGNPSSRHTVDSADEKTPESLEALGERMPSDSLSGNVFQMKTSSGHSNPQNSSAVGEPFCITSDGRESKSLHSSKLKRSKKQRPVHQQPPPLPLSGPKPQRFSNGTFNLPRTDIFLSGLATRQSHLTPPDNKVVSTAEGRSGHEGLDIKSALSSQTTLSLHAKTHHHYLHNPHHRQTQSRKKLRNPHETKALRPPSSPFTTLGMPESEGRRRDPIDNLDPNTNERVIELPLTLKNTIHSGTWHDSKNLVLLSKKSTTCFCHSDLMVLAVPGCGLLFQQQQQLQGGKLCLSTKQANPGVGRGKGGSPEATAATAALLDKGTIIPLQKNYMLTRLIVAMVRGMETEAIRSLLGTFAGPSRDPFLNEGKNETDETQPFYDCESRVSRPLTGRDYDPRRISSDADTESLPTHFQKMNLPTKQNPLNFPSSPPSRHFDGATEFAQLMKTYPNRNFPVVLMGQGKSVAVGEPFIGMRAPRPSLNLGEGPGLVHHHRFRYPVIWDYDDVVTLYMNTLHDAEAILSPHDPILAALVHNTVAYMCLDGKNLRQALEILEYYLNDVSEERVQGPATKSVALGRADGAVTVSTGRKGTPVSARPSLGDTSTSPQMLFSQPSLATREAISPFIPDTPAHGPFSSSLSFANKFNHCSTTSAKPVAPVGDNFGHLHTSTSSTQAKKLQEVPQVVPSWETTVERDQFMYVLSHLRCVHEKLKRRVDIV